jgi:AcrR family transcriptional regulator
MAEPAYTRLQVDERRRQLLERATELFAEHGYDQLSMARIAREAGISKALLYHYFPSKRDLFESALAQGAEEHLARVGPLTGGQPVEQLTGSLDLWLDWIDSHRNAYLALQRSSGIPEVGELIERVREATAQGLLVALGDQATPTVRTAVRAWLWYMDGVCLDWVREGDLERDEVRGLLLGTLLGALTAAGLDPTVLGTLLADG